MSNNEGIGYPDLCMMRGVARTNWYCSLPLNHNGPHIAYESHIVNGTVCWTGPWEDGTDEPKKVPTMDGPCFDPTCGCCETWKALDDIRMEEIANLSERLEEAQLLCIEATNPGVDMAVVKQMREDRRKAVRDLK